MTVTNSLIKFIDGQTGIADEVISNFSFVFKNIGAMIKHLEKNAIATFTRSNFKDMSWDSFINTTYAGSNSTNIYLDTTAQKVFLFPTLYDDFQDSSIDTNKWGGWDTETGGYLEGTGDQVNHFWKEALVDGEMIVFDAQLSGTGVFQFLFWVSASNSSESNITAIGASRTTALRKRWGIYRSGTNIYVYDFSTGTAESVVDASGTGSTMYFILETRTNTTVSYKMYDSWKGTLASVTGDFVTAVYTSSASKSSIFLNFDSTTSAKSTITAYAKATGSTYSSAILAGGTGNYPSIGSSIVLKFTLTVTAGTGFADLPSLNFYLYAT